MKIVITYLLTLLVSFGFTNGIPSVTYEEMTSLGLRCDKHFYSCSGNAYRHNCKCDPTCSWYNDCCFDSPYRRKAVERKRKILCEKESYVTSDCPPTWDEEMLKYYCETYINVTEPLSFTQVLSLRSGVSYRNYYCAMCNEDTDNLQLWSIEVKCNSSELTNIGLKDLKYNKDIFNWGVWYINSRRQRSFAHCDINSVPNSQYEKIRRCHPAINKCPRNWNDNSIRDKCESYQAIIYIGTLAYRNIHCALCNYANLEEPECFILSTKTSITSANFKDIFKFNIPDSTSSGKCRKGSIYDPILEKCHTLTCLQFQVIKDGKCVTKA